MDGLGALSAGSRIARSRAFGSRRAVKRPPGARVRGRAAGCASAVGGDGNGRRAVFVGAAQSVARVASVRPGPLGGGAGRCAGAIGRFGELGIGRRRLRCVCWWQAEASGYRPGVLAAELCRRTDDCARGGDTLLVGSGSHGRRSNRPCLGRQRDRPCHSRTFWRCETAVTKPPTPPHAVVPATATATATAAGGWTKRRCSHGTRVGSSHAYSVGWLCGTFKKRRFNFTPHATPCSVASATMSGTTDEADVVYDGELVQAGVPDGRDECGLMRRRAERALARWCGRRSGDGGSGGGASGRRRGMSVPESRLYGVLSEYVD